MRSVPCSKAVVPRDHFLTTSSLLSERMPLPALLAHGQFAGMLLSIHRARVRTEKVFAHVRLLHSFLLLNFMLVSCSPVNRKC